MVHDLPIVSVLHIGEAVAGGDRFGLTVLGVGERVVARVNRSVSVHADQLISKLNGGLRQRLERTHEVSLH